MRSMLVISKAHPGYGPVRRGGWQGFLLVLVLVLVRHGRLDDPATCAESACRVAFDRAISLLRLATAENRSQAYSRARGHIRTADPRSRTRPCLKPQRGWRSQCGAGDLESSCLGDGIPHMKTIWSDTPCSVRSHTPYSPGDVCFARRRQKGPTGDGLCRHESLHLLALYTEQRSGLQ